MSTIVIDKPKVDIAPDLLTEMQTQVHEMGQVVVHVLFSVPAHLSSTYIRIWPTTYLFDHGSDHRSELVHAENITYYPEWSQCMGGGQYFFTLIFSGLPRDCSVFDLVEHCTNQAGAFEARSIPRTSSDVYYLRMQS